MDEYATENEVANFTKKFKRDLYVFGGDRLQQIKLKTKFPKLWINNNGSNLEKFIGKAQPNEYYVFYLGLFSTTKEHKNIELDFDGLKSTSNNSIITKNSFQCFNAGGIDFLGNNFQSTVNLKKNYVQPLYVGVQIPEYANGDYTGVITVIDQNGDRIPVKIKINVAGEVLSDHGDNDSQRLSRLRWLNSIAEQDSNELVEPFTAIEVDKATNTLSILGRKICLTNTGIPEQIQSYFNSSNTAITATPKNILTKPFNFKVTTADGVLDFKPQSFKYTKQTTGAVCWEAISEANNMTLTVKGRLKMDGFMEFKCKMKATDKVNIEDIALDMQYSKDSAKYFMGIGQKGGLRKENIDWKWNVKRNQDGFWMGAVNAGMKVRLKGANYRSPLINAYYNFYTLNEPKSWGNNSKGGIRVASNSNGALASAYSGARTMNANDSLQFDFDCFVTPFKPINMTKHFTDKYFHPTQKVVDPRLWDFKWIKEQGANVVNIHHNKEPNPTINYPYYDESMPILKKYVKQAHDNGIKVKIYYTTREISNNIPELFAFHSMNGEIICPGPGKDAKPVTNRRGPHKWLLDNLGENFIPAWREVLKGRYKGLLDLAVETTPDSRLENYYIEGLKYTVKNTNIDSLYIDDTSLSRNGFQRARKVLMNNNPDSVIDAHSWSHFNGLAGWTPSAYYYMQNYPYFDKLWYGEGFEGRYKSVPADYWLVEISGIPFGLMNELMGNHQPTKGMLFGMGQRLGWGGTFPQETWKLWNDFGIEKSTFFGYWDAANPIKDASGNSNVKLSSFVKKDGALFTVINWNKKVDASVKLAIDFDKLGLNKSDYKLVAPKLNRIQDAKEFSFDQSINLKPNQGYIIHLIKK
ncbi:glycoside hydrolase domain-containing protein [Lentisphaerota bacterium WC36G]|nr:DUF6067 family protein [Lentisphaerae bacterium WC36]